MRDSFSPEQLERYSRHIILKGVGGVGQHQWLATSAHVQGGAAASWCLAYLVAAGIGRVFTPNPPKFPLAGVRDATALNADTIVVLAAEPPTGCEWTVSLAAPARWHHRAASAPVRPLKGQLFGGQTSPGGRWIALAMAGEPGCPHCVDLPPLEESRWSDPVNDALLGSMAATMLLRAVVDDAHRSCLWQETERGEFGLGPLPLHAVCGSCR